MLQRLRRQQLILVLFMTSALVAVAGGRAIGAEEIAPAEAADRPRPEVPAAIPLDQGGVILELATVAARAELNGAIDVVARYRVANPARRPATVRVAVPLLFKGRDGDRVASAGGSSPPPVLLLGDPLVEQPAGALTPSPLPADCPYGAVPGFVFTVTVDPFESAEFALKWRIPWAGVEERRHFPSEKSYSVAIGPLAAWGPGAERVSVRADFEPPLLGPVSHATPLPYHYDSRGLEWTFRMPTPETLASAERVIVTIFDRYHERPFESLYYARFDADSADYPWVYRFLYATPLTGSAGGRRVLSRAATGELLRTLEEVEAQILARNGAVFEDTFQQLRFQQESWYRPNRAFSESSIRPVERWNLDYARCMGRAARSLASAFDKMEEAEIDAETRRARFLLTAFERCDERFWNPKQKPQGQGGGLRLE